MGKRSRQKRERRREAARRSTIARGHDEVAAAQAPPFSWADHEGLHSLVPGEAPTPAELEQLTRVVQDKMRRSPEWAQIVAEVGPDAAERLLEQCRFELR